jgi:hypothetical protein
MERSFLSMLAVLLSGFAAISAAFAEDSGSLPAQQTNPCANHAWRFNNVYFAFTC